MRLTLLYKKGVCKMLVKLSPCLLYLHLTKDVSRGQKRPLQGPNTMRRVLMLLKSHRSKAEIIGSDVSIWIEKGSKSGWPSKTFFCS